ncbi:MAG TPA: S41 family peptidase [Pyrinomonadaceae bacterium]|nr:S41 family peptidase [Pyrinomonadaceae bacterium]
MNARHSILYLLTLILCAGAMVPGFAQTAPTGYERDRGRAMLNIIKNDLKKYYYDPTFHGMDLDARFKEAEEKMKTAASQGQILGIIAQILVELDDSHTYFVPPARSFTTEYGWQMQMIANKCYVIAVKPGSDAEVKGLKEGDEIISVDGIGPIRENLWKINYTYQALRPRSGVRLVVIKPDGKEQQVDVMAKVTEGKRVLDLTGSDSGSDIFDLIRQSENQERLDRHRYYELGEELFIWKMPAFDLSEPKVDELLGKAKKRKSLILDLRGNGGGYETTLLRMISNLFDHDIKLGEVKRRKETKPLVAKTRGDGTVPGKLIVLIDSKSGSAAELFARTVQLEKRGVVIGDVSAGAVMRSKQYDHNLGTDTVIFFGASITDADVVMTDGKSLERVGVIPDEVKVPTASDLAAKRDPVLAYAAILAGVNISPEKAGALFPIEWKK